MKIASTRSIARSGLDLQGRRLEASARNVANSQTEGYRAIRVGAVAGEEGGVRATLSDRGALMESESRVNIAAERVTQLTASRAFAANLAVLETADEMDEAVLDLKG